MARIGSCAIVLASLAVVIAHSQEPSLPEFEIASIKRNTSGSTFVFQSRPNLPNGDVRMFNSPARAMILRAYPVDIVPPEIIGLPSWADSERYDVIAKGGAGATPDDQRQMWRALLSDRMKLIAHYETRERPSYNLVIARSDRKLGSGLKPSTLDCTQPPTPPPPPGGDLKALALSRCETFGPDIEGTIYAGGVTLSSLARMIASASGRPVIDKTGLDGYFAVTLRFERIPSANAGCSSDDAPSLFTALRDQLGLKLVPTKAPVNVLVLDRLERPTEN
jgi:uncharacterized protein (TIGR03435 family)